MAIPAPMVKRRRAYLLSMLMLAYVPAILVMDSRSTFGQQIGLGLLTLAFLVFASRHGSPLERRAAWACVVIGALAEASFSLGLGIYRYRLGDLPVYVPFGHGLIFLFSRYASQLPLAVRHVPILRAAALTVAGLTAGFGGVVELLIGRHPDLVGLVLFPMAVWWLMRSKPVGTASMAFLIVWLIEFCGTSLHDWSWAAGFPVVGLPEGNPPACIAVVYAGIGAAAWQLVRWLSGVIVDVPVAAGSRRLHTLGVGQK